MALKRITKKKFKAPKISLAKLSNKKLNKLARQGKLKKSNFSKKKLVSFLEERTHKKVAPQADGSHLESEVADPDEIPLEEADYEYYAKPGRDFTFLNDLRSGKAKKKKDVGDKSFDAVEGRHEANASKSVVKKKDVKHLLPTKSKEHGIMPQEMDVEPSNDDEEHMKEGDAAGEVGVAEGNEEQEKAEPDSTVETFAERGLSLEDTKEIIALLCTSIVEHPEEHVNKLKDLRALCGDVDGTVPVAVRKLALLSLLEVFRDIVPIYRIRVHTHTEKRQSMKKETKKLQLYEESLVNHYRHYLETLEGIVTGKPVVKKDKKRKFTHRIKGLELSEQEILSLSEIALKCLCEALNAHPHFNYRTNIISLIVRYINHRNPKFSDMVCECVQKLYVQDKEGDATLEVIRLIGRVIKVRNFEVQPKVLQTFLSLRIKEVEKPDMEQSKRKKSREQRFKETSRRDRKREKRYAYLEKELQDAAVFDDKKRTLRLHTEIINVVFLTYFRILKHARRSILLSTVLEGLAKFAHLINVTFFDDLFSVMTELVDAGDLSYQESLHCIQTAFTLLSGHGAALNIDPQRFYTHLYRTLFHLHAGSSDEDVLIALRCLDVVISKRRRQVSAQRILAFTKRLCTVALGLHAHGALGLLAVVSNIMQDYPKTDLLLDTENQGSGVYQPSLDEPEHCNAHNSALYELHLLTRSYHPTVRQYSVHVLCNDAGRLKQLPAELARKNPFELFKFYNPKGMVIEKKKFQTKKPTKMLAWTQFVDESLNAGLTMCNSYVDGIDVSTLDFASMNSGDPY